jgi:hypothetical protein
LNRPALILTTLLLAAILPCCDREPEHEHEAHTAHGSDEPAPTNRVDIPASVRQNLGITFAKVEPRQVARTLRVPGRFELIPTARRDYRAPRGRTSGAARFAI